MEKDYGKDGEDGTSFEGAEKFIRRDEKLRVKFEWMKSRLKIIFLKRRLEKTPLVVSSDNF
jgi:hypothetical protein